MEENLQYMYKKFGFFLPDADYLSDPEGLIKYLGAKLSVGKVRAVLQGSGLQSMCCPRIEGCRTQDIGCRAAGRSGAHSVAAAVWP